MPLPTSPATSWTQSLDFPSRVFGRGSDDYELYEEDGEFVLSIELPGFEREEISVTWDEGILNVAAEHEDDTRNERRTYHRRFRFPKAVLDEEIAAAYRSGVLEVTLPIEDTVTSGREIEIE